MTRRSLLALIIMLCAPAAYSQTSGEPVNGFPNWAERVIFTWMNRARSDPQYEMQFCGSNCGEAACYSTMPPLGWSTARSRAARFHADHMARGRYFSHTSNCVLASNINQIYPESCDGSASCSCQSSGTTSFSSRVGLFGANATGEIIASPTDPDRAFYLWLYEPAGSSACQFTQSNGHRWLILKSGGTVGVGVGSIANSVGDFGSGTTPTKLVSGAHYPRQASTVELWANWYDVASPHSAQVFVDGTAYNMTLRRGTGLNGAWSASVSGVGTGCHRYFFLFSDADQQPYRYPARGTFGIGPSASCPDWAGGNAADFNFDSSSDLVWRNYSTGQNAIWFMLGNAYIGSTSLPGVADPNWRIEATGDFSGDGKPDLVWRHQGTGANACWIMDGSRYVSSFSLPWTPLDWQIAAAADFNGDGKPDLVWRNYATGENACWIMGDQGTFNGSFTFPRVADISWRIVAAGDFTGDGRSDLIWRHSTTGTNAGWEVGSNGAYVRSFTLPAVSDLRWRIVGAGDYNGDGKLDLVWRHSGTGSDACWVMDDNGAFVTSFTVPTVSSQDWQIVGPR